jgi:hypothetical protein
MRNSVLAFATAAVTASIAAIGMTTVAAQSGAKEAAVPSTVSPTVRTPWGHPDLQGTWDYRTITPLERARDLGDRQFYTDEEIKAMETRAGKRMDEAPEEGAPAGTVHPTYWTDPGRKVDEQRRTSLIIDPPNGRIPALTAEAQSRNGGGGGRRGGGPGTRQGGRADSWLDRSVLERCIAWGLPTALLPGLYNNNIRIVQTPDTVVIVHEMVHDARVIPLDGRPHLPKTLRNWMGDARGRWEGDTLVVETTNFTDKISYRGATPNIKLTERYRRVNAQSVELLLTVEDPATWTQPWTAKVNMRPAEGELYEYACHEGNYGLRNILEVARDEEKAAAEAAAKGSSK